MAASPEESLLQRQLSSLSRLQVLTERAALFETVLTTPQTLVRLPLPPEWTCMNALDSHDLSVNLADHIPSSVIGHVYGILREHASGCKLTNLYLWGSRWYFRHCHRTGRRPQFECRMDGCDRDWDFVAIVQVPDGVEFRQSWWDNVKEIDNIDVALYEQTWFSEQLVKEQVGWALQFLFHHETGGALVESWNPIRENKHLISQVTALNPQVDFKTLGVAKFVRQPLQLPMIKRASIVNGLVNMRHARAFWRDGLIRKAKKRVHYVVQLFHNVAQIARLCALPNPTRANWHTMEMIGKFFPTYEDFVEWYQPHYNLAFDELRYACNEYRRVEADALTHSGSKRVTWRNVALQYLNTHGFGRFCTVFGMDWRVVHTQGVDDNLTCGGTRVLLQFSADADRSPTDSFIIRHLHGSVASRCSCDQPKGAHRAWSWVAMDSQEIPDGQLKLHWSEVTPDDDDGMDGSVKTARSVEKPGDWIATGLFPQLSGSERWLIFHDVHSTSWLAVPVPPLAETDRNMQESPWPRMTNPLLQLRTADLNITRCYSVDVILVLDDKTSKPLTDANDSVPAPGEKAIVSGWVDLSGRLPDRHIEKVEDTGLLSDSLDLRHPNNTEASLDQSRFAICGFHVHSVLVPGNDGRTLIVRDAVSRFLHGIWHARTHIPSGTGGNPVRLKEVDFVWKRRVQRLVAKLWIEDEWPCADACLFAVAKQSDESAQPLGLVCAIASGGYHSECARVIQRSRAVVETLCHCIDLVAGLLRTEFEGQNGRAISMAAKSFDQLSGKPQVAGLACQVLRAGPDITASEFLREQHRGGDRMLKWILNVIESDESEKVMEKRHILASRAGEMEASPRLA